MVKFSASVLSFAILGVSTRAQEPATSGDEGGDDQPLAALGSCTVQQTTAMNNCGIPASAVLQEKMNGQGVAATALCPEFKAFYGCYSNVCICTDDLIDSIALMKKMSACTDPNMWGVCATAQRGANNTPKSGGDANGDKAAADKAAADKTAAEKAKAAEAAKAAAAAKKIADEAKATKASDKAKADLLKSNPKATPAELKAAGKKAYDASIIESNKTKPSEPTTASSGSTLQLPATLVASAVAVLVAAIFV